MKCLRIFTRELQKQKGVLMYEWLLEQAKRKEMPGGIAQRAVAGYGHHKKMHEQHFFELGSDVPVEVCFIAEQDQIDSLIAFLKKEKLPLFYTITDVECGHLDED